MNEQVDDKGNGPTPHAHPITPNTVHVAASQPSNPNKAECLVSL